MVTQEMDTSNGVLLPFYDPDTNMVYLCGKVGFPCTVLFSLNLSSTITDLVVFHLNLNVQCMIYNTLNVESVGPLHKCALKHVIICCLVLVLYKPGYREIVLWFL